jgi:hypothetical protein
VFQPTLVPLFVTVVAFDCCYTVLLLNTTAKWLVFLLVGIFSIIAPLLSVYFLYVSRSVDSLLLRSRKERPLPLLIATLYQCALTYLFVGKVEIGILMGILMLSIALTLLILTFMSTYTKVSIHSAALSGALGLFVSMHLYYEQFDLFYPIVATIFLLGLVMSARLALNEHSPAQVLTGLLVGFVSCFSTSYLIMLLQPR